VRRESFPALFQKERYLRHITKQRTVTACHCPRLSPRQARRLYPLTCRRETKQGGQLTSQVRWVRRSFDPGAVSATILDSVQATRKTMFSREATGGAAERGRSPPFSTRHSADADVPVTGKLARKNFNAMGLRRGVRGGKTDGNNQASLGQTPPHGGSQAKEPPGGKAMMTVLKKPESREDPFDHNASPVKTKKKGKNPQPGVCTLRRKRPQIS